MRGSGVAPCTHSAKAKLDPREKPTRCVKAITAEEKNDEEIFCFSLASPLRPIKLPVAMRESGRCTALEKQTDLLHTREPALKPKLALYTLELEAVVVLFFLFYFLQRTSCNRAGLCEF